MIRRKNITICLSTDFLRTTLTLLIAVFTCLVSGCHTTTTMTHTVQTGVSCLSICKERLQSCQETCTNDCRHCAYQSAQSSAKHYHHYQCEQAIQGKEITRELQSYRDPLQCLKNTCACKTDYHVCVEACKGVIHKNLQVLPTCC